MSNSEVFHIKKNELSQLKFKMHESSFCYFDTYLHAISMHISSDQKSDLALKQNLTINFCMKRNDYIVFFNKFALFEKLSLREFDFENLTFVNLQKTDADLLTQNIAFDELLSLTRIYLREI